MVACIQQIWYDLYFVINAVLISYFRIEIIFYEISKYILVTLYCDIVPLSCDGAELNSYT
jgi:hypothetical protein